MRARVCVSITFHLIVSSKLLFPPSVQMEAVTRTVSCPPTVRQVRDTWKPTVSSTRSLSNLQPAYPLVKPLNKLQAPRQTPTRVDTLVSVILWRLRGRPDWHFYFQIPFLFQKNPQNFHVVSCLLLTSRLVQTTSHGGKAHFISSSVTFFHTCSR